MVDIQNQIFNSLKQNIETQFPNSKVCKDFQPVASTFPTITFYEIDNFELEHTLDYTQRKSNLAFQIDIFTTGSTKESQAKAISKEISEVMENHYHTRRLFANPLVNADKDIYGDL